MDLMLLRQFQRQVLLQCKYVLISASEANKALETRNVEGVFYALQNFLNAGANISKALWGGGAGLFSSQWRRGSWRMRLRSRAARQRAFRMLEPPAARIRL